MLQWWRQEETRVFLSNNGFPYLLQTDHNNYGMIITINLYMNHYLHEDDNDDGQISNNKIAEIRISYTDIKWKYFKVCLYVRYEIWYGILKGNIIDKT